MQLLIQNRADINVVNQFGLTALDKAREHGKNKLSENEKKKFDFQKKRSNLLKMNIFPTGHTDIEKLLIKNGGISGRQDNIQQ